MKRLLVLQLRPEDPASDGELQSFMKFGGLKPEQVHRVRMEQVGIPAVDLDDYWGVLVGGGPFDVSDADIKKTDVQKRLESDLHRLLDEIIERDFPYLGECYGLGMLAAHLEPGIVSKELYSEEVGGTTIRLRPEAMDDPLLAGLPQEFRAFVGHKEAVQRLPEVAVHLAEADGCPIEMIRVKKNVYGMQFHPELDAHALELRVQVYKHAGYFPPESAQELIDRAHADDVVVPEKILRRFVERYQK